MKKTKIKKPIIYSSIWVLCLVIVIIIDKIGPVSLAGTSYLGLVLTMFIVFIALYLTVGWIIGLNSWFEWYDTRDMNKYINNKIKEKQGEVESLQEEIESLLDEINELQSIEK